MFARLSADTDLIRAYGAASSNQAADLQAIAARLATLGTPALGTVGAQFQTALNRAAAGAAHRVAELGDSLDAARHAAFGSAQGYADTDAAAGDRITGRW